MDVALLLIVIAVAVAVGLSRQKRHNLAAQQMICPHCQTKGTVRVAPTKVKRGISGGKATGAVFTGGLSLLATGLSRKEKHLRAWCSNCGIDWLI